MVSLCGDSFIRPWSWATTPFDRVCVDYLILVDNHSKWLEIEPMKCTNGFQTVPTLRKWFSQFGVPIQLVSDNGPQFTSSEFKQFTTKHGIKHIRCSVYHPSSNSGAE